MQAYASFENGMLTQSDHANLIFPWWSFTKTAIAATVLILVERGVFELDKQIIDKPYSIRQLLNHSAGVTDYYKLSEYHQAVERRDQPWPIEKLLTLSHAEELDFLPGEGWMYSNIGYAYIRQLIETAMKQPLAQVLAEVLLQPLMLTRSSLATNEHDLIEVAMGLENSYHPGWVYHGLIVGPLTDAVKLLDALFVGDFLSASMKLAMQEFIALNVPLTGRPWQTAAYGLGLMAGTDDQGRFYAGHTGVGPGSVLCAYHCNGVSAVRFEHADDQGRVESKLIAGFTG